jgi:hypothetical protein
MRKVTIGITVALALLLAGILARNAGATPLTGTVHRRTNYSLVEKAGCGFLDKCHIGKHLVCLRRQVCSQVGIPWPSRSKAA